MSHSLVPVYIKPHLVPFVFKYFPYEKEKVNGLEVTVARLRMNTAFGKIFRSLFVKSNRKIVCDKSPQLFFKVENTSSNKLSKKHNLKFADGRSSFLALEVEYEELLNIHLEEQMELSMYFFIYSWYTKGGKLGVKRAILIFLEEYNLEEYGKSNDAIYRSFYRKLDRGFFDGKIKPGVKPALLRGK